MAVLSRLRAFLDKILRKRPHLPLTNANLAAQNAAPVYAGSISTTVEGHRES